MNWHLLILSLPTQNSTARMRCWRALKASGAAVLRDGVYLLPDGEPHRAVLTSIADDARQHEGSAFLLPTQASKEAFGPLFDRTEDFASLLAQVAELRDTLCADNAMDCVKQGRKLRRAFEQLASTDFFPGEAQRQVDATLHELELELQQRLSPGEPVADTRDIARLRIEDFRGRTWATRRRPWVDRLASAWMIRRFIDPEARFLWLKTPADCPKKALGFDFDGAPFTHVGSRVTFETLLASFGLETPPLLRLGRLVHSLDAGGVQPPEAVGIERVLAGMREALLDDDLLLQAAAGVFEGLLIAFTRESEA